MKLSRETHHRVYILIFSVVIPTHNRLSLVRDAIETVRRQKYENWELIVFDNASEEDLVGNVASLNHPNIRCVRSDEFLPVTDSWNSALNLAKGDYIALIGDDDGLVPDCFSRLEKLIEQFDKPDAVYSSLIQFFQPGVAPWERAGYVADVKNGFFFEGKDKPFVLSAEDAQKAVLGSLQLHRNFTFNMQVFFCSREFLESIRIDGVILHSPFPDYYFANMVMAEAKTIVVDPAPLAIVSVSKASFGYTLFNGLEEKGSAILNTDLTKDPLFSVFGKKLLAGPAYNTSYIATMAHLEKHAKSIPNALTNYARYRKLQVHSNMMASGAFVWKNTDLGKEQWKNLSLLEKLWTYKVGATVFLAQKMVEVPRIEIIGKYILNQNEIKRRAHEYNAKVSMLNVGGYDNVEEVYDAIETGKLQVKLQRVATVYLARCVDGPDAFHAFVKSYRTHPAGRDHDLVVIYKGYEDESELAKAKDIFKGIQNFEVVISDEGFDINAYLHAANKLNHEYYYFMNTFSVIQTDDWLRKLFDYAVKDDVGLVGVSGSYESLYTSYQLIHKVMFLCNQIGLDYHEAIPRYYDFIVKNNQLWIDLKLDTRTRFGSGAKGYVKGKIEKFRQIWYMKTFKYIYKVQSHLKLKYSEFIEFPSFPNPHIRSNGFMVSKEILDQYPLRPIVQKLDACYFESGANSLTSFVLNRGFRAVIVGRNGDGYDIDRWAESGTFRLGEQENLIQTDNQTQTFIDMLPEVRYTHQRMTWGDYLAPKRDDFYDFNMKYRKKGNLGPGASKGDR
jgi:glycosyltransferase involved in cell wall biosynthesis